MQKRANALRELIEAQYFSSTDKSSRAIWEQVAGLAEGGDHPLIYKVSPWTMRNAQIEWVSHRGAAKTLKRESFENIISKLNTGKYQI